MKKTPWILFCVLGLLVIALPSVSASDAPDHSIISPTPDGQTVLRTRRPSGGVADFKPYAPDELLIRFKDGVMPTGKSSVHRRHQATALKQFRRVSNLDLVKLPRGIDLQQALNSYRARGEVLYAEPNYLIETLGVPNDPSFPWQWNLQNTGQTGGTPGADIKAVQAWDITTGSSNVVVAVIDTGIDYNHQDLVANMWRNEADCNNNGIDDDRNGYVDDCHGIDTFNDDSDPMDDDDHGTHVAGIIGAVGNNSIGVAGINWNVRIMACKFLGADGFGTTADAIDCLDYVQTMKDRGVNVVATNNSWASFGHSEALREAIDEHRQRGILFIAAAGNTGTDNVLVPVYPANYDIPNIISVSATGSSDGPLWFSNFGATAVHLYAPGVSILSTTVGDTYASFSGTSMSAAHVTGVAALIKAQNFTRDWKAVKNLILSTGDIDAAHSLIGSITQRRLNTHRALTCANSAVVARLRPATSAVTIGLVPVHLAALHINCANPGGDVTVRISPGNQSIILKDNGLGADQLPGDGEYSATWSPPGDGVYTVNFPDGDSVTITVDADLQPGFPVKSLHTAGTFFAGTALHTLVGNIDSQPDLEIVATGTALGPLYAWKADGSLVPGWPVNGLSGANYPILAALSHASERLTVVSTQLRDTIDRHDSSGALSAQWPVRDVWLSMSAGDLDGDRSDEIIFTDIYGTLHIRRADGTPLPGWPRWLDADSIGAVTIADLDGDGAPELIFVYGSHAYEKYLHAVHSNGLGVPGFPILLSHVAFFSPVIGDIDGDGAPEIVTFAMVGDGLEYKPMVRVFSNQGVLKVEMLGEGRPVTAGIPVLADLDSDGVPEILVQTNDMLHVWRGDGTPFPGWPMPLPGHWDDVSPVVGDVDGDGLPEIVVATRGQVFVYNRSGFLHPRFPKSFLTNVSAITPAIADIDNDGRNEIIVIGDYWIGREGEFDKVWVYDLGGPSHGPVLWGQLLGGPKHQGVYKASPALPPRSILNVVVKGSTPGTVKALGINCGTDCTETYTRGAVVTLTAVPPKGSYFSGWRGGGCQGTGPCTIKLDSDTVVAAIFGKMFTLTVVKIGNGEVISHGTAHIRCGRDCSEDYNAPEWVYLMANAAPGEKFAAWIGAGTGCSTYNYCNVYVDRDITLTVFFGTFSDFTVAVNKLGTGGGTVTSSMPGIHCGTDCQENYSLGRLLTLSATPDPGSMFAGWSGACSGTGACTLTMDGNKTVAATFIQPFAVQPSVPAAGEVGVPYNGNVAPSGGSAPYNVSILKGRLPPGLSLGSPEILGTPSRAGSYAFTVRVTDQLGASVLQKLKLKIVKALAVSTKALTAGRVGRGYKAALKSTGGLAPATWSIISGALPGGLVFDPATRRITGTPTVAGTFNVTFQVTDPLGGLSQKSFAMLIKP